VAKALDRRPRLTLLLRILQHQQRQEAIYATELGLGFSGLRVRACEMDKLRAFKLGVDRATGASEARCRTHDFGIRKHWSALPGRELSPRRRCRADTASHR